MVNEDHKLRFLIKPGLGVLIPAILCTIIWGPIGWTVNYMVKSSFADTVYYLVRFLYGPFSLIIEVATTILPLCGVFDKLLLMLTIGFPSVLLVHGLVIENRYLSVFGFFWLGVNALHTSDLFANTYLRFFDTGLFVHLVAEYGLRGHISFWSHLMYLFGVWCIFMSFAVLFVELRTQYMHTLNSAKGTYRDSNEKTVYTSPRFRRQKSPFEFSSLHKYAVLGLIILAVFSYFKYRENYKLTQNIVSESLGFPKQMEVVSEPITTAYTIDNVIVLEPIYDYKISGLVMCIRKGLRTDSDYFPAYSFMLMFGDDLKLGEYKNADLGADHLWTSHDLKNTQNISFFPLNKQVKDILASIEVGDQIAIRGLIANAKVYPAGNIDEDSWLYDFSVANDNMSLFIKNADDIKILKRGSRRYKYILWVSIIILLGLGLNRLRKPFSL